MIKKIKELLTGALVLYIAITSLIAFDVLQVTVKKEQKGFIQQLFGV